jgi:hypothetical protein
MRETGQGTFALDWMSMVVALLREVRFRLI